MIDETLDWLEENPEAETEEFPGKQKEVEQVANPIMRKVSDGVIGYIYTNLVISMRDTKQHNITQHDTY